MTCHILKRYEKWKDIAIYFGQDIDFYGGTDFKVLQLVYPTTKRIWPWARDAPESFRKWQPILARIGRA